MGRLRVWIWAPAATLLSACLLAGCGGGGGPEQGAAFSLTVLKESMVAGGKAAGFQLMEAPTTTGMAVNVCVQGAAGLKAMLYELHYDPTRWHPVSATQTGLLGQADKGASGPPQVAEVALLTQRKAVHHGFVLVHPQDCHGYSGDGVLARVVFEPGAHQPPRTGQFWTPPAGYGSKAYVLRPNAEASWGYSLPGDYNQDTLVTLADVIPVAVHFGDTRLDPDKPWPEAAIGGVIDGDGNYAVNLADIVPIAVNFGKHVSEFRVYASDHLDDDFPTADDPKADAVPVATTSVTAMLGNPTTERTYFRLTLPNMSYSAYYWVRPMVDGVAGAVSLPARYGVFGDPATQLPESLPVNYDPNYALAYDPTAKEVSFYGNLRGDMDINGTVTLADLQRIAAHFGEHGPFPRSSELWYADADRDGVIDDRDFAYIVAHYGESILGINLYASVSASDIPANPWAPSTIGPLADLWAANAVRRTYAYNAAPGTYIWLRPYTLANGMREGPISEVIQVPAS